MLYSHGEKTRTCAHVAHARADAVAGLEHQRLDAAGHKMRGGRQAHGPAPITATRKLLMHSSPSLLGLEMASKIFDVLRHRS